LFFAKTGWKEEVSAKREPEIVRTPQELRDHIAFWRKEAKTIGLVPTMGALHEGHMSLVRASLAETDHTVVTLFVNPTQFAPNEDYDAYPRYFEDDLAKLKDAGAHLLFAPEAHEMYPQGAITSISVPGLGDVLEGAFRPGFFSGVATIVAKLLLLATPDRAFFGEKDYQQLQVIRRLVTDLNIPVEIEGAPIVREEDGLALSSRNAYLTAEERKIAPELYRALQDFAAGVGTGKYPSTCEKQGRERLLAVGFSKVDYLSLRDAETLEDVCDASRPARILAAAWLGRCRLIDNLSA
jgi:pantoate--beta-alanine ligase